MPDEIKTTTSSFTNCTISNDATVLKLSDFDLDVIRQWFNGVQDATPRYLEQRDFELAARIHRALGLCVPLSVARHLDGEESYP